MTPNLHTVGFKMYPRYGPPWYPGNQNARPSTSPLANVAVVMLMATRTPAFNSPVEVRLVVEIYH